MPGSPVAVGRCVDRTSLVNAQKTLRVYTTRRLAKGLAAVNDAKTVSRGLGLQAGTPRLPDIRPCRRCGSTDIAEVRCQRGPHFARLECAGCRCYRQFLSKPSTFKNAERFVLPNGPHRGRTIGELAATETGHAHLRWLAEHDTTYAGGAARTVLGLDGWYGLQTSGRDAPD
jgi:hypothetical protein